MTRSKIFVGLAAMGSLALAGCGGGGSGGALPRDDTATYEITIQNLTQGQPISGGVLAIHTEEATMWRVGTEASPGIRLIAEEGRPDVAIGEMEAMPGVGRA